MSSNPVFVVIAGPNGAGKSFYSSQEDGSLVKDFGIKSFDFDLEYSLLYEKFSSIMTIEIEHNLSNRVKEIFHEKIEESIFKISNFSFQTNFDKAYTDKWREHFKTKHYHSIIYFLYLDSIGLCKERVLKRFSEGGHLVDDETIESRYIKGLENLDNYFDKYDEVHIIDTSDSNQITKMLQIEKNQVTYLNSDLYNIIESHHLFKLGKYLNKTL